VTRYEKTNHMPRATNCNATLGKYATRWCVVALPGPHTYKHTHAHTKWNKIKKKKQKKNTIQENIEHGSTFGSK